MDTQPADTQPAFGFKDLYAHVVGGMAKAVSERNGQTRQQQSAHSQAVVHTIMGFRPRDVIEVMLAGHCVMFHEVLVESVHATLRGEPDPARHAPRPNLVALDKAFRGNLDLLERYQLRPAEGRRDAADARSGTAGTHADTVGRAPPSHVPPAAAEQGAAAEAGDIPEAVAEPVLASVPARNVPAQMAPRPAAVAEEPLMEAAPGFHPSAAAISACRANPEAMAALDAGDPGRFARAMGLDSPSDAYLAAAAAGSVFDRRPPRVVLVPPRT